MLLSEYSTSQIIKSIFIHETLENSHKSEGVSKELRDNACCYGDEGVAENGVTEDVTQQVGIEPTLQHSHSNFHTY